MLAILASNFFDSFTCVHDLESADLSWLYLTAMKSACDHLLFHPLNILRHQFVPLKILEHDSNKEQKILIRNFGIHYI